MPKYSEHTIVMKSSGLRIWGTFLQYGIELECKAGMSIRQLMTHVAGLEADYVEEKIKTVFRNSSPVDDIDAPLLNDGDLIAVTGAMPGLVGICMGRESLFGSFREGISSCEICEDSEIEDITITLKVFAETAREIAGCLMGQGIIADAEKLADFLAEHSEHLDDAMGAIVSLRNDDGKVRVKVRFDEG